MADTQVDQVALPADAKLAKKARSRAILRYAVGRLSRNVKDNAVAMAIQRNWGMSSRQSYRYCARAWKIVQERYGELKPFDVTRMETTFEQHRIMAIKGAKAVDPTKFADASPAQMAMLADAYAKNLMAADKAADKLAKIRGVYAPERHAHLHGHIGRVAVDLAALTVEELSQLERICERAALPQSAQNGDLTREDTVKSPNGAE